MYNRHGGFHFFFFLFMCRDNLVGCDLMVFIFWEYLGFEVYLE